ncbi:MAG: hypothetical protein JST12_02205 [Armatimonadetes bacterium]|nr:hypothetical protein [Armatimonadota bacterium]
MEDQREIPVQGWFGGVGCLLALLFPALVLSAQYQRGLNIALLCGAAAPGLALTCITKKVIVDRRSKTIAASYGLFNRWTLSTGPSTQFEHSYLLARPGAKGLGTTYYAGVVTADVTKDQRICATEWRTDTNAPERVLDFLTWLGTTVTIIPSSQEIPAPILERVAKISNPD